LRADYERLREGALGGGAHGWRYGRALLARSGLPAWITTWSEHAAASMNPHPPVRVLGAAPVTTPAPDSAPLVSLLALMLLAHTNHAELVAP